MSKELSVEQLKSLMECVAVNKLGELLVETEGMKLRIKGRCEAPQPLVVAAPTPTTTPAEEAVYTPSKGIPPVPAETRFAEPRTIDSPIVGTFYVAASPDQDAFVQVGSQVKEGEIVFIVESMKVMNEVPADKSGIVAEILLANGSPVEFGQPVLRLE